MKDLEKVIEILNKYTKPQDMDYYMHGTIINTQFNVLAKEIVKKLTMPDVNQQRELLLCGVCDIETKHREFDNGDLECLECGNIAKL